MNVDNVKHYLWYAIGFIVIILVLQLIGGGALSENFLMLVIASMVILNADSIVGFLKSYY